MGSTGITAIKQLSNGGLFPCLHSLIQTRGELGEFETVIQTRDAVEGLQYCREFLQLPDRKMLFMHFLIEIDQPIKTRI